MWYMKKKEKSPFIGKDMKTKKKTDLRDKLDRVFSEFIRLRDADENGYVCCISCGKIDHWRKIHCGHFVNRGHTSTRFNEKNCNGQCVTCNSYDEGNNIGYTRGLIKKYGPGIIQELEIIKGQCTKYTDFEYRVLIAHYTKEVKQLKQQKGL